VEPLGVDPSLGRDRGDDQDGTDAAVEGSPGPRPPRGRSFRRFALGWTVTWIRDLVGSRWPPGTDNSDGIVAVDPMASVRSGRRGSATAPRARIVRSPR
jgi:hypothetical protein